MKVTKLQSIIKVLNGSKLKCFQKPVTFKGLKMQFYLFLEQENTNLRNYSFSILIFFHNYSSINQNM